MAAEVETRLESQDAATPSKKPRFQWMAAYELTFFQSLIDSIHDGLRLDSSLKPEAWSPSMTICEEFFEAKACLCVQADHQCDKGDEMGFLVLLHHQNWEVATIER
jgi:hypothetical protein